jgi:hypothetical protein
MTERPCYALDCATTGLHAAVHVPAQVACRNCTTGEHGSPLTNPTQGGEH